jgi:hypothetical protein
MYRIPALMTILAFAPVQAAFAQEEQPGRRTDTGSQQQKEKDQNVGREVAVKHALCMAIEGSELWACAQKAGDPSTTRADHASRLKKHSQAAFQASEQLFKAAEAEQGRQIAQADQAKHEACEQFNKAAHAYSQALMTLCDAKPAFPGRTEGARTPAPGREPAATGRATDAGTSSEHDGAALTLINHAVKEVVEGVCLQQMLKEHPSQDRAAQALLAHAKQMVSEGQEGIKQAQGGAGQARAQTIEGQDRPKPNQDQPATTRSGGGSIPELARLGNELIEAAIRLNEGAQGERTRPNR